MGGCLRRAFGIPYYDPQYMVIKQYQHFVGATPVTCHLEGPAFDVTVASDIGHCENDLPYLDVVACVPENPQRVIYYWPSPISICTIRWRFKSIYQLNLEAYKQKSNNWPILD